MYNGVENYFYRSTAVNHGLKHRTRLSRNPQTTSTVISV